MASPRYSNTCPVPPPIPIRAMSARMMSFALTPAVSRPSTRTSYVFGWRWSSVWVARTISTSLVPMPNASAPNAPCVAVWLSPHTIVMPGWVEPELRPDDVDDALGVAAERVERDAEVAAVRLELGDLRRRLHVHDRQAARRRRGAVVGGRDGLVGAPDREAAGPEPRERLRAGDLVDEVEVDREDGRRALVLRDDMVVPDLLDECSRVAHCGWCSAAAATDRQGYQRRPTSRAARRASSPGVGQQRGPAPSIRTQHIDAPGHVASPTSDASASAGLAG